MPENADSAGPVEVTAHTATEIFHGPLLAADLEGVVIGDPMNGDRRFRWTALEKLTVRHNDGP